MSRSDDWVVALIDAALLILAVALLIGAAYLYVNAVPLAPIKGE